MHFSIRFKTFKINSEKRKFSKSRQKDVWRKCKENERKIDLKKMKGKKLQIL